MECNFGKEKYLILRKIFLLNMIHLANVKYAAQAQARKVFKLIVVIHWK